ncbi:MAG: hypothetical protein AAB395_01660 [Patescibacteria group bacterium]
MAIYLPSGSRGRLEQPQWATQSSTTEKKVTFTQRPIEFEVIPVDSQTTSHETYRSAEVSADTMSAKLFVRLTSDINACRQSELSPKA